jgi:hypothetical protein
MIIRRIIFILGLGFALTMLTGCATSSVIGLLPTPDEFKNPLPQLKKKYPDLSRYESSGGFIYKMPRAKPLIDAWGKPQRKGFSAWMLFPPSWLFNPTNYWYWDFEGKRVKVLIDRPLAFGYKPHVWKLKVEDNKR